VASGGHVEHGLDLGVAVERVQPELAPEAGLLEAAERTGVSFATRIASSRTIRTTNEDSTPILLAFAAVITRDRRGRRESAAPLVPVARRFLDERLEELHVLARLGMPQDAEGETPRRILDRLDGAVVRMRGGAQAVTEPAETLVVMRLHRRVRRDQPAEATGNPPPWANK